MKTRRILFGLMFGLSLLLVTRAHALSEISWERNADADLVDHYELFTCTAPITCSPLLNGTRFSVNVAQPPLVVGPVTVPPTILPTQRIVIPWPVAAPVLGRMSVIAVDTLGNRSGESNIVVFRSQALNAPKSLTVK